MPVSKPSPQDSGARPISFVLVDNPSKSLTSLTLYIRPEDLTRSDSSRLNAQQTLGNTIWADNFGPGMPTINIAGHTGWRRPADVCTAGSTDDGVDRFTKLKAQVFTRWHSQRQLAIKAGNDPDTSIQLQFVDQLDQFACVVAPLSFVLRRSRSRPLLVQYQIAMIILSDQVALPPLPATGTLLNQAQKLSAGLTSILGSLNAITAQINSVRSFIDASIATPIAQFMQQTALVFSAVMSAVNAVQGVTDSLIAVARLTAQCGVNIFRTLAAVAGLPTFIKGQIMALAGAYSNVLCVLENVFAQQLLYPAYDPLFGSSNCSSTSGGRPPSALAGLNPFQYTNPQQVPDGVVATTQAQTVMRAMASTDIVRSPPSLAQVGATAGAAAAGIAAT